MMQNPRILRAYLHQFSAENVKKSALFAITDQGFRAKNQPKHDIKSASLACLLSKQDIQTFGVGRAGNPLLGDDGGDVAVRGYVKSRVACRNGRGGKLDAG